MYPLQKKLGSQFQFAEKKNIPLALICGEDEIERGVVSLKNLLTRESFDNISLPAAIEKAQTLLKK